MATDKELELFDALRAISQALYGTRNRNGRLETLMVNVEPLRKLAAELQVGGCVDVIEQAQKVAAKLLDLHAEWCEVIVGNLGCVHNSFNRSCAEDIWNEYVRLSTQHEGRAAGEPVTLLVNGVEAYVHPGDVGE